MIPRHIAPLLETAAAQYPIVSVTGPRQSGKTTLVRATFPAYDYVSLEAPDHRAFALDDPRGFLRQFDEPVILDEVQNRPVRFVAQRVSCACFALPLAACAKLGPELHPLQRIHG
ncbi:MAG: AAA family ATPase [Gammaproteobacteria bacterium]